MSAMVISWGGSVLGVRAGFKGAQGARAPGLTPAKSGRAGGGANVPHSEKQRHPAQGTRTDRSPRPTAAAVPRPRRSVVHVPASISPAQWYCLLLASHLDHLWDACLCLSLRRCIFHVTISMTILAYCSNIAVASEAIHEWGPIKAPEFFSLPVCTTGPHKFLHWCLTCVVLCKRWQF